MTEERVLLTIVQNTKQVTVAVPHGSNLRKTLQALGYTPYAWAARQANCNGRGLCATCGVRIQSAPAPEHWHDKLAARFGYPRLSCQITVQQPLTVHIVTDKWFWGGREK